MKQEVFNNEFNKVFQRFGNDTTPGVLNYDAQLHKKMWDFLVAGDSYYFVINHHTMNFEIVSPQVKNVLGYLPEEINISFLNEKIHAEDLPWFLTFGKTIIEFFMNLPFDKLRKYKVRYDIRIKKSDGNYARILYQGLLIEHDTDGRFLRTFNVHTDITYLKHDGKPMLSILGMDGEPSYIDIANDNVFQQTKEDLSRREIEVLRLLIEGNASKKISGDLHISKQTVDMHRKNMLRKKKLGNTAELISKAIRHGWI